MTGDGHEVQALLDELVAQGREVGLQVAAYLNGRLVVDAWAGLADEAAGRPVDGDTLFPAFSMSKGVTATCIHMLADRGLVDYDVPVADYWPEFGSRGKGRVTLRHVLTHRAGIPQDPPGFRIDMAQDWDAVCRAVADMEPLWEPGTRIGYHALTGGWILGEVLRRVDGRPLDQFLQDEVCGPLGIDGMHFGVSERLLGRVATLRNARTVSQLDTSLTPSLEDFVTVMNRPEVLKTVIPAAGLATNARSVARLYAALAAGGELDGVRILSPGRVAIATAPQPEDLEVADVRWWEAHSLGYTLGGGAGPRAGAPAAFGYEGVGTIAFADPSRRFAFAFLKNLMDLSEDEMTSATLVSMAVGRVLGFPRS